MDDEKLKAAHGNTKHHKKTAVGYDRPGRSNKRNKQYRLGKTHEGKSKTLRDKR